MLLSECVVLVKQRVPQGPAGAFRELTPALDNSEDDETRRHIDQGRESQESVEEQSEAEILF